MKAQLSIACALLIGCSFGGSDEDPRIEVGPPRMDASVEEVPDDSIDASPSKPPTPRVDASDTAPRGDAGRIEPDASMPPTMTCTPSTPIPTCDPVHNTGCPPLTQCDIDPAASTPTGRCVFFQASLDPKMCTSALAESCEAKSTCVANECRTMCYCDGDCPTGQCCSDSAAPGPAGSIKLCQPC